MDCTRFWLVRHAVVSAAARSLLYGRKDVEICADALLAQAPAYRALAARLPQHAQWVVSPLGRTQQTADAIFRAGYGVRNFSVEPGLTEQDLGDWQGLKHADLPARLADPAHPFWPLGAGETPPGGESMQHVVHRVGTTIEFLAESHPRDDLVCISHGGAIRAAIAHALGVDGRAALHFSIHNLSLTILERFSTGWRVMVVNEGAEIPF